MINNNLKQKINLKYFVLVLIAIFALNIGAVHVSADAIFNLMGVVLYKDGSAQNGNNSTVNSYARARAYRSNIDTNYAVTNKPSDNHIYPAGYANVGDPAYFLFDVGSSAWNPAPVVGDSAIVVLETYSGLNGWGGASYVAGIKKSITQNDIAANGIDYGSDNLVMEVLPTPSFVSNGLSSITVGWTGLWDNSSGSTGGTAHNSIVGYGLYRRDNGGAFQLLDTVPQDAGTFISYTDTTAVYGHSYEYQLSVLFEWSAHNPSYYESQGFSSISATMAVQNPNPDRLVFTSAPQTINAGNKSAVITVQSRDNLGNVAPVLSDTTVDLSSNSTGVNKAFYNVVSNACSTTVITNVVITTGSASAQFCYYDEVVSPSVWVLTAHKSAPVGSWIDATQNIIVQHTSFDHMVFNLESPQNNKLVFTGTNTLTLYDQYNNLINDFDASLDNVTITVSPNDGNITGLSGTNHNQLLSSGSFVNGVANFTGVLKFSGTSGDHVFTATTASGKVANSDTIYIIPSTATHLSFSAPANVTAGGQFTLSNITALDEFDNVDTNFTGSKLVTFTGASNSPLGYAPSYTTSVNFSNGVSTTDLHTTLYKVEDIALTATTQGLSGISNTISVAPAIADHYSVVAPVTATAGESFDLTSITAYDHFGNLDTNYTGIQTLNYSGPSNGPTSGTPSYTTSVEFVAGNSNTTLSTILYNRQLTSITVSDGSIAGTSNAINVGAGIAGSIEYVSGDNQTARINSFVPDPLIVRVKDVYGNLKDNQTVDFIVTQSDGYVSVMSPVTVSNGTAQTNWSLGSTAGTDSDQVEARVTGASGSPIVFNATATQLVATNLVVTAPSSVIAGVPFNISIDVTDQNGDPFDYNGTKTISYSGASNSPNLTAPTFTTSVTFTNGHATNISTTLVKVENIVLSLQVNSESVSGTSNAIQVNAAATNRFVVVAPSNVTSGVSFNITSITAIDQFANITTNYSGLKTLVYTGPNVDPVTHNGPAYTTSVNFTNGAATTTLTTTLYKAEVTAINISNSGVTGTSNNITVTYAQPYTMYYVSGNNQTGAVGQQLANPLKVVLINSQGQPALDKTVVFSVVTGGGSIVLPTTVNNLTGEVSADWILGTTAGIQSVTASASGVADTVNFNATAVADAAAAITITPSSISTFETHASNDINLCLQDQYGNQVITNLVRTINLSSTSLTGEFALNVSGPWGITSADIAIGQSCIKVNYLDSTAGTYTFTASAAGLSSASITLDVAALIPTSIVVTPTSFTVNENNTQHLTAIVYDQFGFAMSNVTPLWEVVDSNAGSIDQSGLFTPSHVAGTYTNAIKVSYSSLEAFSTPTVTVNTVELIPTSITVSPTSFTVSESSTQLLTATVYDQFGQPMSGLTLVWSVTNSNAGSINQSGLFTPSHNAGTFTNAISVTYASLTATSTPTITLDTVPSTPNAIQIFPETFTVLDTETQQLSAVVYDQYNQPIPNVTIIWSMVSANAGSINASGLFTPSHTAGEFPSAIQARFGSVITYASPTIIKETQPEQPNNPQEPSNPSTPSNPEQPSTPTTPSTPTVPITVQVNQNYYSNDTGTVPITVQVPAITILSPKPGSLIYANGYISISGNSVPETIVLVKDAQNNILGSVTSDKKGYWKMYVSRNKFAADRGSITATTYNADFVTAPVTFSFRQRTVGEYIYDLIFSN